MFPVTMFAYLNENNNVLKTVICFFISLPSLGSSFLKCLIHHASFSPSEPPPCPDLAGTG